MTGNLIRVGEFCKVLCMGIDGSITLDAEIQQNYSAEVKEKWAGEGLYIKQRLCRPVSSTDWCIKGA